MPGLLSWLAPVLVAPFIGSFLGVLILRLPDGRPIVVGRSACDHCGRQLGARDLIPLLSFALLRGRCRHCGQAIGWFPVAIELAALAVAVCAACLQSGMDIWVACVLGWTLLAAAWIDARTMILPDVLTLPLLVAGRVVTSLFRPEVLTDHALAAALGYLLLILTARVYRRLRGRDGLGEGDAKLLGALGAWLGLGALPFVLVFASCLGLAAAGASMLAGRRLTSATAIPFGPFLSLAGWLLWLYQDWLYGWLGGDL